MVDQTTVQNYNLFMEKFKQCFAKDTGCALCPTDREDLEHLFKDCPFAKAVWIGSNLGIRTDCLLNGYSQC